MFEQLSLFQQSNKAKSPQNFVEKLKGFTFGQAADEKKALFFLGENIDVVRRPYQRSLSILVKPSGEIRVTCAKRTSIKAIYRFLEDNRDWLKKVLDDQKALRETFPPKQFIQGEEFLYLGDPVYLNFTPTTHKKLHFSIVDDQLVTFVPKSLWSSDFLQKKHPEIKPALVQFYKNSGKKVLEKNVERICSDMKLFPKKISYRAQKTRWGSCSSNGHISLNWKLIAAPMGTLQYVIIHELAHLEYHNHSKAFWSLVKRFCSDYEDHKKWLRDNQFHFDFLATESELHK